MTATNHAITGAVIGLLVQDPYVALPAAFVSHFVCDAIPHFDPAGDNNKWLKSDTFKKFLTIDALLCVILVAVLAGARPAHWLIASICAFLATSPDLFWINRFIKLQNGKKWKPSLFSKFADKIQWFTGPTGAVVELIWLVSGIFVLHFLVH